jgi:hypothetical protein
MGIQGREASSELQKLFLKFPFSIIEKMAMNPSNQPKQRCYSFSLGLILLVGLFRSVQALASSLYYAV